MPAAVLGFVHQQCISVKCGAFFYAPEHAHVQAKANKERWIWCPACGSKFHWTETETDVLRKKLESSERSAKYNDERADQNWQSVLVRERRIAYWKGIVTRLKRARRSS